MTRRHTLEAWQVNDIVNENLKLKRENLKLLEENLKWIRLAASYQREKYDSSAKNS